MYYTHVSLICLTTCLNGQRCSYVHLRQAENTIIIIIIVIIIMPFPDVLKGGMIKLDVPWLVGMCGTTGEAAREARVLGVVQDDVPKKRVVPGSPRRDLAPDAFAALGRVL